MKKIALLSLASLALLAGCGPTTTTNPTTTKTTVVTNSSTVTTTTTTTAPADTNGWKTYDNASLTMSYPAEMEAITTGGVNLLQTAEKADKSNDLMVMALPTENMKDTGMTFDQFFEKAVAGYQAGLNATASASGKILYTGDANIPGVTAKKIVNSITKDGKTGQVTVVFLSKGDNITMVNFIQMVGASAAKDYSSVVEAMIRSIKLK